MFHRYQINKSLSYHGTTFFCVRQLLSPLPVFLRMKLVNVSKGLQRLCPAPATQTNTCMSFNQSANGNWTTPISSDAKTKWVTPWNNKQNVLFYLASWTSTCKELIRNFMSQFITSVGSSTYIGFCTSLNFENKHPASNLNFIFKINNFVSKMQLS